MTKTSFSSRALLIVDQEPIRQSASKEMQTLYGKMQGLRSKIEDFETKDRPAFTRWLRTEFQEPLSELARLQDKLGEAEDLANEVQMVRFALNCSYYDAYVNAMERRRKGVTFEESFGTGDDEDAQETFEDFQERKYGKSKKENGRNSNDDDTDQDGDDDGGLGAEAKSSSEGDDQEKTFWSKVKDTARAAGDSVKARYRELARLLHPDLRGSEDAWSKELWERTQAAYTSGNTEELEQLLVLARVSSGSSNKDSSVWDLRKGITYLKRSLKDLRSEIGLMSQDMAWGFIGLKDRTRLRRKISYDLEYQHDEAMTQLENLEAQLARWSVPPARRSKVRRGTPRTKWDLEIDF